MAKMNGVNSDIVTGPVGSKSTRMNPAMSKRNNLASGGVNQHLGGSDEMGKKPGLGKGQNGQGKYKHDKR